MTELKINIIGGILWFLGLKGVFLKTLVESALDKKIFYRKNGIVMVTKKGAELIRRNIRSHELMCELSKTKSIKDRKKLQAEYDETVKDSSRLDISFNLRDLKFEKDTIKKYRKLGIPYTFKSPNKLKGFLGKFIENLFPKKEVNKVISSTDTYLVAKFESDLTKLSHKIVASNDEELNRVNARTWKNKVVASELMENSINIDEVVKNSKQLK